jgi:hypothetical protein
MQTVQIIFLVSSILTSVFIGRAIRESEKV